jgi:hypothetical protein
MREDLLPKLTQQFKRLFEYSCRVSLIAAVFMFTACDQHQAGRKNPHVAAPKSRVQAMFDTTKTVCFGQFIVDVPVSTVVAWGTTAVPLEPIIYPRGAAKVKELAQEFIAELKSEKAINHNHVPLLLSVNQVADPEGAIVIGYEDFEAINYVRVNGYFRLNDDGVIFKTYSFVGKTDRNIATITRMAKSLRRRAEREVPSEPGNCIELGFVPDERDTDKEGRAELIQIGFRLSELPDTHLSIFIHPSNPNYTEQDSFEWRLNRLEKTQKEEDPTDPLVNTKMLRRGPRQIHDWLNGFEALSRTPELPEMHSIHDFVAEFPGVPSAPLKPYLQIQMQTGVAGNTAGATKADLTDQEAVAVWDKITSTIWVRPTLMRQSYD